MKTKQESKYPLTPRPWKLNGHNLYSEGATAMQCVMRLEGGSPADRAYIEKAVNSYDKLKRDNEVLAEALEYAKSRIAAYINVPVAECIGGEFIPIDNALFVVKAEGK